MPLVRSHLQRSRWTSSDQPSSAAARACRRWPLLALLCVMLSLIAACVGPKDSGSKVDSFQSGGLGLTLAEWERRYNLSPLETPVPSAKAVWYAERHYAVTLWDDGSGGQNVTDALIYGISFDPKSFDMEEQQAEARSFLPVDAELQEVKLNQATDRIHYIAIYHSRSLAARYPPLPSVPDPWKGMVPGTIRVSYGGGLTGISAVLQEPPELHEPTEPPPTRTPFILLPTPLPTEPLPPLPLPSQPALLLP